MMWRKRQMMMRQNDDDDEDEDEADDDDDDDGEDDGEDDVEDVIRWRMKRFVRACARPSMSPERGQPRTQTYISCEPARSKCM